MQNEQPLPQLPPADLPKARVHVIRGTRGRFLETDDLPRSIKVHIFKCENGNIRMIFGLSVCIHVQL